MQRNQFHRLNKWSWIFETPDNFCWYDADHNDVTEQFYNDNINFYLNNDLDSIMANFRNCIVFGVKEVIEEVPNNSIQVRACVGDGCPEGGTQNFTYSHEIYHYVEDAQIGGDFDAIYYANGTYTTVDNVVTYISDASFTLDRDTYTSFQVSLYRPRTTTTEYYATVKLTDRWN